MVKVNSAGTAIASYAYDGRGFRVAAEVDDVVTHDYFNDSWQVIEQREGSSADPSAQFVWSNAYVNALVQERRDTDANGSLDRTLWPTHDANYNVTAAVRSNGVAAQRYLYDAYGERSLLDGTWQPFATPTPAVLQHGFQGGREDGRTKLIPFQHRYLNTSLHRWTTRDPAGYVDGGSLYQYGRSTPVIAVDPSGLICGVTVLQETATFGHAWIEYPGSSAGFWPRSQDDALWVDGVVRNPDCTGNRDDVTVWQTTRLGTYGITPGVFSPQTMWLDTRHRLGAGASKGLTCHSATCEDIVSCVTSVIDEWKECTYSFPLQTCRTFVGDVLTKCCMTKGDSTTHPPSGGRR
jgi:RHS repeat-associated protein